MVRESISRSNAIAGCRISAAPDCPRRNHIIPAFTSRHPHDGIAGRFTHCEPSAGDLSPWHARTALDSAILPLFPPTFAYLDTRRQRMHRSVRYNNSGQMLDTRRGHHRRPDAPALICVLGGAPVSGTRMTFHGHALMSGTVNRGRVCVSIDYRGAPLHRPPRQLEKVPAAVDGAHNNAAEFGGDPNFIAVAGASAGGHLAALTGLVTGADAIDAEFLDRVRPAHVKAVT